MFSIQMLLHFSQIALRVCTLVLFIIVVSRLRSVWSVDCLPLARSKSEMSNTWSNVETFKLLEIWGQDDVQTQLNKSKRDSHVYDRIASEMRIRL